MAVNGVAPGIPGRMAKRLGVPVMHFSTDYVFDGTGTKPYREADAPNPQNVYGRTKLAGDLRLPTPVPPIHFPHQLALLQPAAEFLSHHASSGARAG